MYLVSAFIIGLAGSLHCVGMCGPLMLAAQAGGARPSHYWRNLFAYQSGRLLAYGLIGILFGTLGWGIHLFGWQQELAIASGILLVITALLQINVEEKIVRILWFGRLQLWLRHKFAHLLKGHAAITRFILGGLNGFLPCGLVYLAVVGAANTPNVFYGAGYMISFGLGTTPLLLVSLYSGHKLRLSGRRYFARFSQWALFAIGCLLIWRGSSIDIPLDFWTFQDMVFPPMCH